MKKVAILIGLVFGVFGGVVAYNFWGDITSIPGLYLWLIGLMFIVFGSIIVIQALITSDRR